MNMKIYLVVMMLLMGCSKEVSRNNNNFTEDGTGGPDSSLISTDMVFANSQTPRDSEQFGVTDNKFQTRVFLNLSASVSSGITYQNGYHPDLVLFKSSSSTPLAIYKWTGYRYEVKQLNVSVVEFHHNELLYLVGVPAGNTVTLSLHISYE